MKPEPTIPPTATLPATLALALALALAHPAPASATVSEFLYYTSPTATLGCEANGPVQSAGRAVFVLANDRLPVILGLEKAAARRGRRFTVIDGAFRQEIRIDGVPVELGYVRHEWSELVDILTKSLGCEPAPPVYLVPAFSIQVELLPAGSDVAAPLKAWSFRRDNPEQDLGLLSHSGDCGFPPYWTHTYAEGRIGIRYGVFATVSAAAEAIATLGWEHSQPQIVRTTLRADSVNTYFGINLALEP